MFFSFFYDPYQNSCAMHIPLKATYSTEGAYNDWSSINNWVSYCCKLIL